MKRTIIALLTLCLASCAVPVRVVSQPPAPHKFGSSSDTNPNMYWAAVNNAAVVAAGNNGTTTIFDTTNGGTQSNVYLFMHRLMVVGYCTDQDVTVTYQVKLKNNTSTWVTVAGTGATTTLTHSAASPPVQNLIDYLVQGVESRLVITNGATGPASCNLGVALFYTRELGQ